MVEFDKPFFDPILLTTQYQKVVGLSTIFFLLAHYFTLYILSNIPTPFFTFNKAALKKKQDRAKFLRETASCIVGGIYHTIAAPVACYAGYLLCSSADTVPSLVLIDPGVPDDSLIRDSQNLLMILSEVFVGYMVCLIYFWLQGWEEGHIPLVHHLIFLSICVISANYNFVVGAASLAMEMSSPALNIHLVFRNLAGERARYLSTCSMNVFALLFLIFRILVFGAAVSTLLYIRISQELPYQPNIYMWNISCILFVSGLLLQLKWLIDINKKAKRHAKRANGT